MPAIGIQSKLALRSFISCLLVVSFFAIGTTAVLAQDGGDNNNYSRSAVGGILVNADGILDRATVDQTGQLAELVRKMVGSTPEEMQKYAPMRKVSLRKLEAAIAEATGDNKPIPDAIRHLAGLQEIQYVFVDRENHDIIIAGPAEGWTIDASGYMVGTTSGRAVLQLGDLIASLRAAASDSREAISCSIDPTPEGVARLRKYIASLKTIGNPDETASNVVKTLGNQKISITGIDETSHFARVLVAADYQMKCLAMNLEPSPVKGLPSFLSMMKSSGRGLGNMMPRWWLEPEYKSVSHSPDRTAWAFTGSSVKAMTEDDFFKDDGSRTHTGKANPLAKRWANLMTKHYEELANANPIFAQLQGCMNMAVVSTLIVRGDLTEMADCSLPILLDSNLDETKFPTPREIKTQASLLKTNRHWIVSASGGVEILPENILSTAKPDESLKQILKKAIAGDTKTVWWWD
jgi:Protein of unknown function (DUF1598)